MELQIVTLPPSLVILLADMPDHVIQDNPSQHDQLIIIYLRSGVAWRRCDGQMYSDNFCVYSHDCACVA